MVKTNSIKMFFAFGDQFRIEYNLLLEVKNANQCVMVLMKNVTTISKGDQFI
jgi:hypothetical protein